VQPCSADAASCRLFLLHCRTNNSSAALVQQLPDLPEAAVACILKHVPLRRRLSRCALVCRAWAAVAVTVPALVDIEIKSSNHCEQLQEWLGKHGGVVVELTAYPRACDWSSSAANVQAHTATQFGPQ
jgi:hypothetical protein